MSSPNVITRVSSAKSIRYKFEQLSRVADVNLENNQLSGGLSKFFTKTGETNKTTNDDNKLATSKNSEGINAKSYSNHPASQQVSLEGKSNAVNVNGRGNNVGNDVCDERTLEKIKSINHPQPGENLTREKTQNPTITRKQPPSPPSAPTKIESKNCLPGGNSKEKKSNSSKEDDEKSLEPIRLYCSLTPLRPYSTIPTPDIVLPTERNNSGTLPNSHESDKGTKEMDITNVSILNLVKDRDESLDEGQQSTVGPLPFVEENVVDLISQRISSDVSEQFFSALEADLDTLVKNVSEPGELTIDQVCDEVFYEAKELLNATSASSGDNDHEKCCSCLDQSVGKKLKSCNVSGENDHKDKYCSDGDYEEIGSYNNQESNAHIGSKNIGCTPKIGDSFFSEITEDTELYAEIDCSESSNGQRTKEDLKDAEKKELPINTLRQCRPSQIETEENCRNRRPLPVCNVVSIRGSSCRTTLIPGIDSSINMKTMEKEELVTDNNGSEINYNTNILRASKSTSVPSKDFHSTGETTKSTVVDTDKQLPELIENNFLGISIPSSKISIYPCSLQADNPIFPTENLKINYNNSGETKDRFPDNFVARGDDRKILAIESITRSFFNTAIEDSFSFLNEYEQKS